MLKELDYILLETNNDLEIDVIYFYIICYEYAANYIMFWRLMFF
jgi:hypothetical protein